MQSNNPALNRTDWGSGARLGSFRDVSPEELQRSYDAPAYTRDQPMTVDDVVRRTLAMIGLMALTGAVGWLLGPLGLVIALPAMLVAFVLSLVIIFKQITNPAAILTYAALEGLVLGAVSHLYESAYHGIVLQAVIGTAGVFFGMVFVYTQRWIRATPKFTRWVTGALIGVVVLMVVNLLASVIGGGAGLGLRDGGPIAIGFSLLCIGIAALTFVLDFDGVEKAVQNGAPQRYAWYASFGIVLGLVWLYFEILRLLSYLRD